MDNFLSVKYNNLAHSYVNNERFLYRVVVANLGTIHAEQIDPLPK